MVIKYIKINVSPFVDILLFFFFFLAIVVMFYFNTDILISFTNYVKLNRLFE